MKIDIVHPGHYRDDGSLVQATSWRDRLGVYLPHLGPALLAALAPEDVEVRIVEEYLENIDLDTDADLIAISAQVMQFDRCRDLAKAFRARGKTTVLGGYLPSLLPDKVEGLFDAIVLDEGDEVWPELIRDAQRGNLRRRYRSQHPVDLTRLPIPRYDLIKKDRLVIYPVQATRGCPFRCGYCSIAAVFDGAYRKRPVAHVIRDIEATGSRNFYFCDDNLCEDVAYADELFTAMEGMKLRWGTQTTINVARHPKLLEKARKAGCVLLAVGVETLSFENLEDVQKTFHPVEKYAEAFHRIMDAGISPHALIIFGLPHDDRDTFLRTVEYLESLSVPVGQFFILTPYPGTPTGDRVWEEGRVFDENLSHLREPYVVFKPEKLTPAELREGWWGALEAFYSLRSIGRRVFGSRRTRFWINLGTNLYYWSKVKAGVHPVYFGY